MRWIQVVVNASLQEWVVLPALKDVMVHPFSGGDTMKMKPKDAFIGCIKDDAEMPFLL